MLTIRHNVLFHPLLLYLNDFFVKSGCLLNILCSTDRFLYGLSFCIHTSKIIGRLIVFKLPLWLELTLFNGVATHEVSHAFLLLLLL